MKPCRTFILINAIILFLMTGCIDDDYKDCVTGLNISFYSKSPCQSDTIYPDQINNMTLCVFDNEGILLTHWQKDNVELNKNYVEKIDIASGLYTVIAWSDIDNSYYNVNELQSGVTKKSDLLFQLKRMQNIATSIDGKRVYFGESPAAYVETASIETSYTNVAVNLLEVTNRLTISIEGLSENEYEVSIESDNGSMNVDGSIAKDDILKHESKTSFDSGVLKADFTLLKLETGFNNTIVIKNKTNGNELYRGSLLGTLILKNPEINLSCDHDFTIKFTAEDQCSCGTYIITEIWVNDWLVHSYNTDI